MSHKNGWPRLISLIITFVFLQIIIVDKTLYFQNKKYFGGHEPEYKKCTRYISLAEHEPLADKMLMPDDKYMISTDTLVQKRYKLRIDGDGFIMPSKIHENPELTIVFLGGSIIECFFVDEENRFPYLTGRIIEKETGKKTNSYNCGVSAANTLNSLDVLLNKILPLKPDIVIMQQNANDLYAFLLSGSYWRVRGSKAPIVTVQNNLYTLFKRMVRAFVPDLYHRLIVIRERILSCVYRQADKHKYAQAARKIIHKDIWTDEFRMNLQTFIDICITRKIKPVLMTEPTRFKERLDESMAAKQEHIEKYYGIPYKDFKDLFDSFNEVIREVGQRNNILVIDLEKEIPKEGTYIYDSTHLNNAGSKLAAQIIARELQKVVGI